MIRYIAVPKNKNKEPIFFSSAKEVREFFRLSLNKFDTFLEEGVPVFLGDGAYFLDEDLNQ